MRSWVIPIPKLGRAGGYWTIFWYDAQARRRQKRLGSVRKVDRSEAEKRYTAFLDYWRRGKFDVDDPVVDDLTISEFIRAYHEFARGYYVGPNGKPGKETLNMIDALRPLLELHGHRVMNDLRPRHLKQVQERMVADGLARKTINDRIKRIRRAIRWAVVNDMAEPAILEGVRAVEPLRYGRTTARESEPIQPVSVANIRAVLRRVSPTVRAMIVLQYRTGMRPQEVCRVRWADINVGSDVWTYTPAHHKTAWKGMSRLIAIGPKGQRVLERYRQVDGQEFVFSPKRALAELYAKCSTHRRSVNLERKTDRKVSDRYTTNSYRQAIQSACAKAGIASWAPNQLRHACATRVRHEFGLEQSQAVLGHSKIETTQIYAQRNMALARQVMAKIG